MTDLIDRPATVAAIIVIVVLVLRMLFYHLKHRKIRKYRDQFEDYVRASSEEKYARLAERQHDIVSLFREAIGESPHIPYVEQIAHGYDVAESIPAWDNLTLLTDQHAILVNRKCFHLTVGYFHDRRNETLNVVYWLELLAFHPRKIVDALGGNKDGFMAILLNIVAIPSEIIALYEWFIKH